MTQELAAIRTLGNLLDDTEKLRIMNGNRIGAIERTYGSSLPTLDLSQKALGQLEHQVRLDICRAWRKHPLAPWAKGVRGLGELSIARLIATIGDPYIATPHHWEDGVCVEDEQRPRTVSQLCQFCGVGNPNLKRAKGMTQAEAFKLGNPRAKKQLYLIAGSFLKAGNRDVYDAARAEYAERKHERPCPQCHAIAGDPWRDGHKHMAAMRKVEKRFLRDLWLAARALHPEGVIVG